ncbi:MAG: FAD-binding oxidoreductase [Lentisphaeria bacterium]|jgi:Na+-transporting NADH:ubiquinone oxidoreductase subunit F
MGFRISINGGARTLSAEGSQSLLAALKAAGLAIPSACGGRGRCGLCRVKLAQELPRNELEAKRLSEPGWHLACQVPVDRDLEVELPPELVKARDFRARVTALEPLTHDIRHLHLELLDGARAEFIPGQYMQFELPPEFCHAGRPVTRTYSLASPRREPHRLSFMIRLVPNGLCTTWIFTKLQVGDVVRLTGPFGDFHLRDGRRELLFIAGGSGLAPFASILDDMRQRQDPRRTRLFFGARSRRDLYWLGPLAEFERRLPDFRFIPALSEPQPADGWTGEAGLITEAVARHCAAATALQAYLCGPPGMVDACIALLAQRGLPSDQIFFDKFA